MRVFIIIAIIIVLLIMIVLVWYFVFREVSSGGISVSPSLSITGTSGVLRISNSSSSAITLAISTNGPFTALSTATVPANGNINIEVIYQATSSNTGTLHLTSSNVDITVQLSGSNSNGNTGNVTAVESLDITSDGSPVSSSVLINNSSNNDVTLSIISTGPFVAPASVLVPKNGSASVQVIFTPSSTNTGSLKLTSSGVSLNILLNGIVTVNTDWRFTRGSDISGNELYSVGNTPIGDAKTKCAYDPNCKAFVVTNEGMIYFKSDSQPVIYNSNLSGTASGLYVKKSNYIPPEPLWSQMSGNVYGNDLYEDYLPIADAKERCARDADCKSISINNGKNYYKSVNNSVTQDNQYTTYLKNAPFAVYAPYPSLTNSPWKCLPVGDSYLKIRAGVTGYPECASNDGVNCAIMGLSTLPLDSFGRAVALAAINNNCAKDYPYTSVCDVETIDSGWCAQARGLLP